jgi:hypothetical protein
MAMRSRAQTQAASASKGSRRGQAGKSVAARRAHAAQARPGIRPLHRLQPIDRLLIMAHPAAIDFLLRQAAAEEPV